jgi:hypothetical protein
MDTKPSPVTSHLSLGRLLRMQAMVTQVAQTEATAQAAAALVRAYNDLRGEMLLIIQPEALADLRAECERLFLELKEPAPFQPAYGEPTSVAQFARYASEAHVGLQKLQGWIQGLIDELTLERRLVLEAEAKAKTAAQPPTGFRA